MKKTLLLDCDGVLSNFVDPTCEIISKWMGETYTVNSFNSWDLFTGLPKAVVQKCFEAYQTKGWCFGLEPYEEALFYLPELKAKFDLYIVTSPMGSSEYWLNERKEWLHHKLGIDEHRVVQTAAKHLVKGDIFVDDKPENVENWAKHFPDRDARLWDMPYNRSAPSSLVRARSWDDILILA